MLPPSHDCLLAGTHRLIPSMYSPEGTVLARLTSDEKELEQLVELDGATNARLLGEQGLLPGIGVHELLFGVPYSEVVNASFTHAAPDGGRFNSSRRGAWYAGVERETSMAEVAFHKQEQLKEIDWQLEEVSTYDDYLADFAAEFHDLRGDRPRYRKFLRPEPIPDCYRESQQLAAELIEGGSNGVVYPSVRRAGGTCVACFRPALVYHVRRAARLEFRLSATIDFSPGQVREVKHQSSRR